MSGICGVQTLDGSTPPALLLSALGRALSHRGPDGEARYSSGGTGLVRTALSVKEGSGVLEAGGLMAVADGRLGAADPVPLAAVAACEPAADRISLSRDAFGTRPLYYAETVRGLVFASEPRAILACGLVQPRLCPEALAEILQIQFTTGRHTLFAGIERVLPGETVVAERGKVVERRRVLNLPEATREMSEPEALGTLRTLLDGALGRCLPQGEVAGLLFDGRIEACALAAGLRAQGRRGLPFFALKAEDPGVPDAATLGVALAKACAAEAVLVPFGAKDFFALLPKVVACLDDPGADYSAVAAYRLAAAAALDVGALISGVGGDVLFGGLGRYRSALRPLWLGGRAMRARGFLEGMGVLRENGPAWRDGLRAAESRLAQRRLTPLQIVQALDCTFWLPNEALPVLDRCLAAHSLALRAPFLELELARFAFTLPSALKIASGRGSALLRRFLAEVLPEAEPFGRHRGSALAVTRWIAAKAGTLGPLVARNQGIVSLCDPSAVRRLYERLSVRPSKRLGHAAWQLLFFALWHRIHIEGKVAEGDTCALLA